jgi:hypothetical protein
MKDIDGWLGEGGPESESMRPFLDAIRANARDNASEPPLTTPEEKQQRVRGLFERLDADIARKEEASVASSGPMAAQALRECRSFEVSVTVRSPQLLPRIAEPPPTRPPAPPPPAMPLGPRPAMPPVPEPVAITSPALEVPPEVLERMGRLPFSPRAGEELARTMPVPVLDLRKGQTAALGDDSIEKPVPALPFPESPVGEAVVPIPSLSLEQYASLCAEVAMQPKQSDEIMRRYNVVNKAVRRALDEHWEAQLASSPEMFARYNQAVMSHAALARSQRG